MGTDGKIILAVNGEIYNHVKLRSKLKNSYKFKTHSDCEVIIPLVRRLPFLSSTYHDSRVHFARAPRAIYSTKNTTRSYATSSTACSPSSCSMSP